MTKPKRTLIHGSGPGSGGGGEGGAPPTSTSSMISRAVNTALMIEDADQGRTRLLELIAAAFETRNGARRAELQREIARLLAEQAAHDAAQAKVRLDLSATSEWIPASPANRDKTLADHVSTPFSKWYGRDQVETLVLFLLLLVAVCGSAFVTHANLVATGIPIFLEQPLLPWAMAALPLAAAYALKAIGASLRAPAARGLFSALLGGAALASVAVWIALFAERYHGLGATGLGDIFGEPSAWESVKQTAFTAVTLTTEMLVSAVIALRLSHIAIRYEPDCWMGDFNHPRLVKHEATLTEAGDALQARLGVAEGELAAIEAALQADLKTAALAYDARRGRSNDLL